MEYMGKGTMRVSLFISNFKKYAKRVLGIVLVFVVLFVLLQKYMDLTRTAESSQLYDFYNYVDKDTIDVLCIGSSHVGKGINPVQMWDDYGISAYDMWGGAQSVWFSYYYLEEALKTQNPKVVILDVYTVVSEDEQFDSKIPMNLLTLETNFTKYKALKTAGAEDYLSLLLTFPLTHTRYSELNQESWEERDTCLLGYAYSTHIEPYYDLEDVSSIEEKDPISELAETYLRKTIELCEGEGINIVLTNTPWPLNTKETQMKYNYVGEIAQEYGVPFINGCLYTEQIGLDYTVDSSGDGGHLNHYGVTKYTAWLENYLVENYSLVNHKGDEKYSHWEEASIRLHEKIWLENQAGVNDFTEYVSNVLKDEYNYAILLCSGDQEAIDLDMKSALSKYGIELDEPSLYVIVNNQVVHSAPLSDNMEYYEYREKRIFDIKRDGETLSFSINGNERYSTEETGPLIYVYSYNTVFGMESWSAREMVYAEQYE